MKRIAELRRAQRETRRVDGLWVVLLVLPPQGTRNEAATLTGFPIILGCQVLQPAIAVRPRNHPQKPSRISTNNRFTCLRSG
jgi:hypothetical protein